MSQMRGYMYSLTYWIFHIVGVQPLSYSTARINQDSNYFVATWSSSKRGIVLSVTQLIIMICCVCLQARNFAPNAEFKLHEDDIKKICETIIGLMKSFIAIFIISSSIRNRHEMKNLLTDVQQLFHRIVKDIGTPARKEIFSLWRYVAPIAYGFLIVLITNALIAALMNVKDMKSFIVYDDFFLIDLDWWPGIVQLCAIYMIVVVSIYLQIFLECLNTYIKGQFPCVDQWDWDCWNEERKNNQVIFDNIKSSLAEYREIYRAILRVAQRVNSIYGAQLLLIISFNQLLCLFHAYFGISSLGKDLTIRESQKKVTMHGVAGVICLLRIIYIFHRWETVIKTVHRTTLYIGLMDSTRIDYESKQELSEFLDEINGGEIRFTASDIFSLDYASLYVFVSGTAAFGMIVIQYVVK